MTYDPRNPVTDGNRGMIGKIFAELMRRGRRRARRGENAEIARLLGTSAQNVADARYAWNHHDAHSANRKPFIPGGRAIWPQPDSLVARLMALEVACPWLTRAEQAKMLGTSCGMVRDTAYRIRKRRPDAAPARPSFRRAA